MDNDQTMCPECLEPCEKETRDERGMTWQTEFDEMYQHITNEKNRLIYKGYQYVTVHACIKAFIKDLLDRKAKEIERIKNEAIKYPMQGANPKLIHDFNLGYDKGLLDALSILKEDK